MVLRTPDGRKTALGEALWVGSQNLLVQRRSRPLTWTYDPWLRPQPTRRVPQDGLLPQAQTALHELPGAQRPAPLPGSPPGSAAEFQLRLEQVWEALGGQEGGGGVGVGVPGPGAGWTSASPEITAPEGHGYRGD